MTNQHVDFYIGKDDELAWFGSCESGGELLTGFDKWRTKGTNGGVSPFILFPDNVHCYLQNVDRRVRRHESKEDITRETGWRWDYATSAESAWAYTHDGHDVYVSHFGSAWIKVRDLYTKERDVTARTLKTAPVWPETKVAFPDLRDFEFTYPELAPLGNPVHTIVVTCNSTAVLTLATLLRKLQTMGNVGSSRTIDMKDYGSVYFDGDGSDRIGAILVNGIDMDDWTRTLLDLGASGLRPSDYENKGQAETENDNITCACVQHFDGGAAK
jgi:hypothetical protein